MRLLMCVCGVFQNDAALFEHNRRFQAAVLRTMEVQMTRMEAVTLAKDNALQQSETVREDLAVGFAQMKTELTRINKTYQKTSGPAHSAEGEASITSARQEVCLTSSLLLLLPMFFCQRL